MFKYEIIEDSLVKSVGTEIDVEIINPNSGEISIVKSVKWQVSPCGQIGFQRWSENSQSKGLTIQDLKEFIILLESLEVKTNVAKDSSEIYYIDE